MMSVGTNVEPEDDSVFNYADNLTKGVQDL